MTLDETKEIMLLIKGIHLEFVVTEATCYAWHLSLADHEFDEVQQATVAAIKNKHYFEFPKPGDIVKELRKKYQLEWSPEAIATFISQWAWERDAEQVISRCPPNVGIFLKRRWKQLIRMPMPAMIEAVKSRAEYFNAQQDMQPAITERTSRMLQGIG
jgi:hypothetical protein